MEKRAPAKINLTLEIINRREDGFHNIASVVQTIDLCDTLIIREGPRIQLEIDRNLLPGWDGLKKSVAGLENEDNLVYQAAILLKEKTRYRGGAVIQLKKKIPSASGLGGGSSDAAAALKGLNELWGTGLSNDSLAAIGANIGSDIPFFIYGGTCLVKGRGEKITLLKPAPQQWVVLLIPFLDISHKTRTLYSHITPGQYTAGDITRTMTESINSNTPIVNQCWNVFTGIYPHIFPEYDRLIKQFEEAGAKSVHVCGSGPSLYCLTIGEEEAKHIAGRLKSIRKSENLAVVLCYKSIPAA